MSKLGEKMRGITLMGLLFFCLFIVVSVILAMNLIPPYMEHYTIKNSMEELAKEANITQMPKAKVRDMMLRRMQVNNIKNISPDALEVERKDDEVYLVLNYEQRVHVVGNIDAVLKFNERVKVE